MLAAGFISTFFLHTGFSTEGIWNALPGYAALALEAFSSSILEHTQGVLLPTLGPAVTTGSTILGAFLITTVSYLFSGLLVSSAAVSYVRYINLRLSLA